MTTKTKAGPEWTPVEEGAYGVVVVMAGKFKGETGNYDDDAEGRGRAIVYFGSIVEPYEVLPRRSLRVATKVEAEVYWKQAIPRPQPRS